MTEDLGKVTGIRFRLHLEKATRIKHRIEYRLWKVWAIFRYDIPRIFKPSNSIYIHCNIEKIPIDDKFHDVTFKIPPLPTHIQGRFRRTLVYDCEQVSIDGMETK